MSTLEEYRTIDTLEAYQVEIGDFVRVGDDILTVTDITDGYDMLVTLRGLSDIEGDYVSHVLESDDTVYLLGYET